MLDAQTLTILADAADALANLRIGSGGRESHSDVQPLRIAGHRARDEAEAANGLSTPSTLHWCMTVDSNRVLAETLADIVAEHRESETARSDLADALRDWSEIMAGTENVSTAREDGCGIVVGDMGGSYSLSPFMLTMIHRGLANVDWHRLAVHYLSEEA